MLSFFTGTDVTVIVPAFNEAASVADTIRSLQAQTARPREIIVVDDCSTDGTGDAARALGVTVVRPPANTGSKAGAQTFALRYVRTPLTIAVDADTVLAVDAIERLLLDVPHGHLARAGRLVQPHNGRRHGSHLEPVSGRVRGALRAESGVLPHRAPHLPPHGDPAAALVARVRPEREAALARRARGAVPPLRRRGGVLGCHGGCCAVSDRPPGPRPPAGEPLGPVGLCDRRPGRPGSCARGCRPAARGRAGPGERSGVLPAPHRQRGLLPACCMRRAAAGSPPAALQKGTLTVNAGLPGTGIGGIFYLASALAMPLREAYRRVRGRAAGNRRVVAAQLAIAGGILGAMWVTGRLLGLALAAARPIARLGTSLPPSNVLLIASVTLALGTLVGVLVGVELLRLLVHRGPRSPLPGKAMPAGRADPHVGQERRRVAMLLILGLVVPDPHGALAQSP